MTGAVPITVPDVSADDSSRLTPQIGETYPIWWRVDDVHYLQADASERSTEGGD